MRTIRRLTAKELPAFVDLCVDAYPGMNVVKPEDKNRVLERVASLEREDPTIRMYGVFQDRELVGGMRLFDFRMTMFETEIPVGGLGMVAVDLVHKKEHICKEMVEYFITHYAEKKTPMLALYPFRPDFYKKMGFGYGAKVSLYRFKPGDLPSDSSKAHVSFVTLKDIAAIDACYHRYIEKTHGMMRRNKNHIRQLDQPAVRIVAYKRKNRIEGYLAFSLKNTRTDNWLTHELVIQELIYENREALAELMAFVRSQSDQVHYVHYRAQDDYFHYFLTDLRNDSGRLIPPVAHECNSQGMGLMYRVIDTPGLFAALAHHNFNGQDCRLKITLLDSFYPRHAGSYVIHFAGGKPSVRKKAAYDLEISLDVSDFSSLVMGVVPFDRLYEFGKAEISDTAYLDTVTSIFAVKSPPRCLTQF